MRLNIKQREIIERTAIRHFGNDVRVYLFGSRVIEEARGGDIDLYLEAVPEEMVTIKKRIAFIVDLKKELGDQKIDVVFKSTENKTSRFQQIIDNTKIPIN
jgi:predicted nucleotidyltransferase